LRVYGDYIDTNNYERASFGYSSNQISVGSDAAGSGVHRKLNILGAGIDFYHAGIGLRWSINTGGHFFAATDNVFDIGASGANRPRNIYVAGGIIASNASVGGPVGISLGAGVGVNWAGNKNAITGGTTDGVVCISNYFVNDFIRLQLGSTTDAFPAIARDGAGIKITGAAGGSTSWIKVPAVAVSALPSAATAGVGARAFVNDALTPVFGSAVVGLGSVTVPVYSTGSAWNVG
jgi:hypothetical protein